MLLGKQREMRKSEVDQRRTEIASLEAAAAAAAAAAHETAKHKSEAVMEMPDAASSGGPNERRPELAKLSSRLIQLQLQLSDYEERLIQAHETMKERDDAYEERLSSQNDLIESLKGSIVSLQKTLRKRMENRRAHIHAG